MRHNVNLRMCYDPLTLGFCIVYCANAARNALPRCAKHRFLKRKCCILEILVSAILNVWSFHSHVRLLIHRTAFSTSHLFRICVFRCLSHTDPCSQHPHFCCRFVSFHCLGVGSHLRTVLASQSLLMCMFFRNW